MLFAAGAVAFERWTEHQSVRAATLVRALAVVVLVAYAALVVPLELPIFSKDTTAAFVSRTRMSGATKTNQGHVLKLPQDYADMLGWPELAAAVAHAYDSLPPEKRAQVVLIAENYGEAGALEYYGPRLGLPRVISAAGSYWFFGPGEKPGTVAVSLGVKKEDLEKLFETVTPAGRVLNPWGVPEESDVSIYVSENPRTTLQELWPSLAGRN
jgi:hypothetical protein